MKKGIIPALAAIAMLGTASNASAISYSGSLSYSGGGITTDVLPSNLANNSTVLSWAATDTGTGLASGWWRYSYTWTAQKLGGASGGDGLSHLIIELSPNVGPNDFTFNSSVHLINTYSPTDPGNSNPDLPGSIFGVKINGNGGNNFTFTFDSSRAPVWGDFYAKDGNDGNGGVNVAYNTGFLASDPIAAPANGSINNHILRPDTTTTTNVPDAGSTMALLGLVLGCIGFFKRKN